MAMCQQRGDPYPWMSPDKPSHNVFLMRRDHHCICVAMETTIPPHHAHMWHVICMYMYMHVHVHAHAHAHVHVGSASPIKWIGRPMT